MSDQGLFQALINVYKKQHEGSKFFRFQFLIVRQLQDLDEECFKLLFRITKNAPERQPFTTAFIESLESGNALGAEKEGQGERLTIMMDMR